MSTTATTTATATAAAATTTTTTFFLMFLPWETLGHSTPHAIYTRRFSHQNRFCTRNGFTFETKALYIKIVFYTAERFYTKQLLHQKPPHQKLLRHRKNTAFRWTSKVTEYCACHANWVSVNTAAMQSDSPKSANTASHMPRKVWLKIWSQDLWISFPLIRPVPGRPDHQPSMNSATATLQSLLFVLLNRILYRSVDKRSYLSKAHFMQDFLHNRKLQRL